MIDQEHEHRCNSEPFGYCGECEEPIESYQSHFYNAAGKLYCSRDCRNESSQEAKTLKHLTGNDLKG